MPVSRLSFLLTVALLVGSAISVRSAPGDITFRSVYVPPGAVAITDVWGYSADGRNYAVVGDETRGVYVIDVTDPALPTLRKDLTGLGFAGFDVKVWDHYIYVCNGSANGTTSRVIDISDLDNPIISPPFQSAHNLAIDPAGYLIAELIGLRFYDITTDPMSPAQMWTDGFGDAHDASVVGNLLYDFRGTLGTHIWDITNRNSRALLGVIHGSVAYHHSGYPTSDGRHLYICDELSQDASADITVWNIEDPGAVTKVDAVFDPDATVHNLYIVGDLAYVSYYTAGFRVYDISTPENTVLADEYDTTILTGQALDGCFGVYPFTGSDLVYATDQDNGLFVFSVEPHTQVPVAFTAVDARAVDGGITLSWEVFADEPFQGFRVYRNDGGGDTVISGATLLGFDTRAHVDRDVIPLVRYEYTVAAVREDASEVLSAPVSANVPAAAHRLYQNHPNPFNPTTIIEFVLDVPGPARLAVFDTRGRHVRTLFDKIRTAGQSSAEWDGTDRSGRSVASGLYFYRLTVGNTSLTRRMVLLK